MTENNEDYEGVTLKLETVGWPEGLEGIIIKEQIVYRGNGSVTVIGDPIWNLEELSVLEED